MRRGFLAVVLLVGAIGGYTAGFCHMRGHFGAMHEERERHWAQMCVDAARQSAPPPAAPIPPPPPPPGAQ